MSEEETLELVHLEVMLQLVDSNQVKEAKELLERSRYWSVGKVGPGWLMVPVDHLLILKVLAAEPVNFQLLSAAAMISGELMAPALPA